MTGTDAAPRPGAVLIYAPGLGRYATNSAAAVADVVAATLDSWRLGGYRAETSTATAPRCLKLGKTVVGPDGPVLEVFELDYRERLTEPADAPAPRSPPGVLTAAWYGAYSVGLLARAARRPAKSPLAKVQLLLGAGAAVVLTFAAVSALLAALAAMGLLTGLPEWATTPDLGSVSARGVALGAGAAATGLWLRFRAHLLRVADQTRQNIRYVNEERHRNTVVKTLDDAIDALLDNGWAGPIHVLGYSFGSLVVVDAMFPRDERPARSAGAVASLTTIGWPGDFVRLYFPGYVEGRSPRRPDLAWTNVFIPADVFASNLRNGNDAAAGPATVFEGAGAPSCIQYTDEELSFPKILRMRGFRTHSGYWDHPSHDSCFTFLVDRWVPAEPVEPAEPAAASEDATAQTPAPAKVGRARPHAATARPRP